MLAVQIAIAIKGQFGRFTSNLLITCRNPLFDEVTFLFLSVPVSSVCLILAWQGQGKMPISLFSFLFINHHQLQKRQIYQLANGGPVPACTPLHTWISLITSLALPDCSQHFSRLDCQLDYVCVCVCACVCVCVCVSACVCVCEMGVRVRVWLLIAYHFLDAEEHISSNSSLAVWLKQCLARTPHSPCPTRRISVQYPY